MLEALRQGSPIPTPAAAATTSLAGTQLAPASLTGAERQALDDAALPPRAIAAHTDLVREGDPTDRLYVLAEGWACRYKTTRDGNRQIVALLVPGDVANLDTLTFGRPGCGVRVLSAAKATAIRRERIIALASGHPGIASALMRLASIESAMLSQRMLCLGRQSAQQRLAHLFCELAVRISGDGEADSSSFDLPLTQEQLADALGLTPVHVNRTLQQLRLEGLIGRANRSVTLPDVPKLRHLAEFDPAYLHIGAEAEADARSDRFGRSGGSSGASAAMR